MSSELRSVTVKFQKSLFEQISKIAEKRGESLSDTIRYLVNRGLDERVLEKNTELIAEIVRAQVEQVIKSYTVIPFQYDKEYPISGTIPSLDNTEHPAWQGSLIFERRITLNRPGKNSGVYDLGLFKKKLG